MEQLSYGQQKEESSLQSIPIEVGLNYYSTLDYESLENLCRTDKTFNRLCRDPEFWKSLIYKRFGKTNIPSDRNPQSYYKSLIIKYDIRFSWLSIDRRKEIQSTLAFNLKQIGSDDASIAIDVFDATVYPGFDRTIEVTYNKNIYTLQTDFANNLNNVKGYLRETIDEIDRLRGELELTSNIKVHITINHYYDNNDPNLSQRFTEELDGLKKEIISRGNYIIEMYDDTFNSTLNYNGAVRKTIEFYHNKEGLSKFIKLLATLRQGRIALYQPYIYNGENVILIKQWSSVFSDKENNFVLEKYNITLLDLDIKDMKEELERNDLEKLWDVPL